MEQIGPYLAAGRDPFRCRLGQAARDQGDGAACAQGRAPDPRPSDRRHRAFGAVGGLCRTLHQPLVRADAGRPMPTATPIEQAHARSGRRSAAMSRPWTPAHHDMVLAITSHIPHLVAYNIVGTVADLEQDTQSEVIKFSASGFRDFTRIAASDPVMWRDVFLTNRDAVLEMLGRFLEDLRQAAAHGAGRRRAGHGGAVHPHAQSPPLDHHRRAGNRGRRFRPPARATARTLERPSGTAVLDGAAAPLVDVNVEADQSGARAWRRRRRLARARNASTSARVGRRGGRRSGCI